MELSTAIAKDSFLADILQHGKITDGKMLVNADDLFAAKI